MSRIIQLACRRWPMRIMLTLVVSMMTWAPVSPICLVSTAHAEAAAKDELALISVARRDGIGSLVAARLEAFLRAMITAGSVVTIAPEEVVKTGRPRKRRPNSPEAKADSPAVRALAKADQARLAARVLLDENKKPETALKLLKAALRKYEKHFVELSDYTQFVDAYGRAAKASIANQKPGTAVVYLKKALTLQPTFVTNRGEKELARWLVEARKRLEKRPKGSVKVTCEVAGAQVFVDGVLLGPAPVESKDLYWGTHYVQVRHPKAEPWGAVVTVRGKTRDVEAKLVMEEDPAENIALAVKPSDILPFAQSGNFHSRMVKNFSFMFSRQIRARYLLYGMVAREGNQIGLHMFIFDQKVRKYASLPVVTFKQNLSNMQVKMLEAEGHIGRTVKDFASAKEVTARPAVYSRPEAAAPRPAVVVAPPVTRPSPTGPSIAPSTRPATPSTAEPTSPRPTSPVVRPTPATSPVIKPAEPDPYSGLVQPKTKGGPEFIRKPWFWGTVGGVVVAGVVTAVLLSTRESQPSPNFMVDAIVVP